MKPNGPKEFWARVEKTDSCWLWRGSRRRAYGRMEYQGGTYSAHRLAYLLAYGSIPFPLFVLHRCDNPLCVRPDHLFVGTPSDNMCDKVSKGRQFRPRGEKNGKSAKLTWKEVAEIRRKRASNTLQQLADEYGVTISNISAIALNKSWKEEEQNG